MARGHGPGPGPHGPRTVEKPKDFKGTTKKIIKNYLADYKWQLLIVFIFAIRKHYIYYCRTKNFR